MCAGGTGDQSNDIMRFAYASRESEMNPDQPVSGTRESCHRPQQLFGGAGVC